MADEATEGTTLDTAAVMDFLQNSGEVAEAPDTPVVDPAETAAPQGEQTQAEDPLGPDPDLSDLSPEARAFAEQRILQLRQGFTKRTTELADANRILEAAGGDPEAVLEAYEFQRLLSDAGPEGEDARARLYQALAAQYGAQQQQVAAPADEPVDPFSEYDLPPEIRDALSLVPQLNARLQAFEAGQQEFAQQQAQQAYLQEVVDDLSSKWTEITTEYPDLVDAEDYVFALGAHTNGNLLAAVDLYRQIETQAQAKLFEGSVRVPGGQVAPPAGGGHSTEPVEIEDFKQAGAAAKEFIERMSAELS